MPATYDCIATTTISGTSTNSVTFSSIPGTYTDLRVVYSGGWTTGWGYVVFWLRINGDTGSNYSSTNIQSYGSGYSSGRETNQTNMYLNYSQDSGATNCIVSFDVMNYSNSTTNKTVLASGRMGGYGVMPSVSMWRSTSEITSLEIRLADSVPKFTDGAVISIYGIKAA